jgi:hypothetical protein
MADSGIISSFGDAGFGGLELWLWAGFIYIGMGGQFFSPPQKE